MMLCSVNDRLCREYWQKTKEQEMREHRVVLAFVLILFISLGCGGGSDTASLTRYISLTLLSELQMDVRETSGLAEVDGRLYTHNDSGGSNLLYEINATTGEVLRTIMVNGATNEDWEDLACDDTYLYIADIGNSLGARNDLKIYKILKSDLRDNWVVNADEISFSYGDQTTFSYAPFSTPYDAEALIAFEGQLYIFTKNWADYTTRVYRVPNIPGDYVAIPVGEKVLDVLVTGASFDEASRSVALIGYSNPYDLSTPFKSRVMVLHGFSGNDFFSGEIAGYEIAYAPFVGQVEAVLFYLPSMLYISAEGETVQSVKYPGKLYATEITNQ